MRVVTLLHHASAALISLLAFGATVSCTNIHHAEQTAVPLRIAFTNIPLSYAPVILADSLGFYKNEGLSATIDTFPNGAKTMQALLGGSADIGTGSYDQNIQIAAEGRDVKSFTLIALHPSRAVILTRRGKAKIHRIEDLKGTAVGVGGFGSIAIFSCSTCL